MTVGELKLYLSELNDARVVYVRTQVKVGNAINVAVLDLGRVTVGDHGPHGGGYIVLSNLTPDEA